MATRSLTYVYDDGEPVVNIYVHYDGYVAGHGYNLAKFLEKFGTPRDMTETAAMMVFKFKTGPGNVYLYPTTPLDCGQEYEYHIHHAHVVVNRGAEQIFFGTWAEFSEFCEKENRELMERWEARQAAV